MEDHAIGPSLPPGEPPWPLGWESDPRIDDGHPHDWESVLLQGGAPARRTTEEVIRCATCHAPRCGLSRDPDPCMNRRHHRDGHLALSGAYWPVGGSRV